MSRRAFTVGRKITDPVLTGLKHWVEADSGITKDGSNIVSVWADKSGNGTDWGTPTSGNLTWVAAQINGLPVLRSPGATGGGAPQLRQAGFFTTGNSNIPAEAFVILKNNDITTGYAWGGFSTDTNSAHWPFTTDVYENFGITPRVSGTNPYNARAYSIYNITCGGTGATYVLRQKGTQFYSGGPLNTSWAGTFCLFAGNIAGGVANTYGLNGDIAAIMIYDHALSSPDRAKTYSYLSQKYAIS